MDGLRRVKNVISRHLKEGVSPEWRQFYIDNDISRSEARDEVEIEIDMENPSKGDIIEKTEEYWECDIDSYGFISYRGRNKQGHKVYLVGQIEWGRPWWV